MKQPLKIILSGLIGGFVGNGVLGALFSSPPIKAILYNPDLQSQLFRDVTPFPQASSQTMTLSSDGRMQPSATQPGPDKTVADNRPPAPSRNDLLDYNPLPCCGGAGLSAAISKYTPDGGRIGLSACREGNTAVVRITDTGLGIPANMLPLRGNSFPIWCSSIDALLGIGFFCLSVNQCEFRIV